MKKKRSLQWKLTFMTAFIVIASCLLLSYFISRSAMLFFVRIEESAITMLPQESGPEGENIEVKLDPEIGFSGVVENTSREFWMKSLSITLLITLISSSLMFFVMGRALKPLRQLAKQVEDIQAKNLRTSLPLSDASTEILRLSNAFNEMLQRLGDSFAAQKQFSARAAHELRTPLAVIRTKLDVLEKDSDLSLEDYREAVQMVQMQTDRLSHVIDQLLEMTELKSAMRNEPIRLADMLEEVICDLGSVADEKKIQLIQQPGDAVLMGNDTLIYRAIYNLIENAIKYNHEGGEVRVAIRQEGDLASVQISDTGAGIHPDEWEAIFEPFYQAKKSGVHENSGAGLGLALVKEIAVQHGGSVRVLQSSEEGSVIELTFPLGRA